MKKIMTMGLMLAMAACSEEPTLSKEQVIAILTEEMKGDYVANPAEDITKVILLTVLGGSTLPTTVDPVTIDAKDFTITTDQGTVTFTFLDEVIDDAWLVYEVTSGGNTKYTALGNAKGGGVLTEFTQFRNSKKEVKPDSKLEKFPFFLKPATRSAQDSSITTGTVNTVSDL